MAGFWSAMASNLTNQSCNVLSKKLMANKEDSLDNVTLFSIITVMSFILMIPVTLFMEGVKFTPSYLQAANLNVKEIYTMSLLAALCFHAYQQVITVTSVLFFRTPVYPVNALGTGIALAGVFLYSRVN